MYLRDICGREEGAPPPVDLVEERENGDFVRALILDGTLSAAHDLSDGGLLVALAEMCLAGGTGAEIALPETGVASHAFLYGEDQARYLIATDRADKLLTQAHQADVPAVQIGYSGGPSVIVKGVLSLPLSDIKAAHEAWLPAYMNAAE